MPFPLTLIAGRGEKWAGSEDEHESDLALGKENGETAGGPDIVIAPSIQKHFTRIVDSTFLLNSFSLSESSAPASAGTFARLTIHPLDKANLEELMTTGNVDNGGGPPDDPVEHRVWERCRVDVIKV